MNRLIPLKILGCLLLLFTCYVTSSKASSIPESDDHLFQSDTTNSGKLKFLLLDENERVVPQVKIINSRTQEIAVSDSTGSANLAAGFKDVIQIVFRDNVIQYYTVRTTKTQVVILSTKNALVRASLPVVLTNDIVVSSDKTATSTQAVYNKELIKMPVTSVKNALVGRLAGLYATQPSGRPGADEVNLSVRGQSPLVLIDGIPRSLSLIDLEEIESVTLLKDALSTAMLGIRGSNGALAITTKKGIPGSQRISFTAQSGVQTPLKRTKTLDAYNYATLYNEARVNGGLPALYSGADLTAYQNGTDPIGHPNVNWQDQILEDKSVFKRYDISVKGGSKIARYYVGMEYQGQDGQFKESSLNTYGTNNNFSNYIIRSNVDINLTPKTTLGLHIFGRILNSSQPGNVTDSIFRSILYTPNNAYPVFNSNGSYGGNAQFQNNIYAQAMGSGYRLNYKRDILTDLSLRRTLDEVLPGLWFQGLVSYGASLSESTYRDKSFAVFQQTTVAGVTAYQQFGTNGTQNNSTSTDTQNRQSYVEAALGYTSTFGKHGVNAQVRATSDNVATGSDLSLNYYGGSTRIQYDYDSRYVAEITAGLNRSNRYPKDTPLGFFPAAGLSWNITKEHFMSEISWLNELKLFTSYGKTGWDRAGYYIYNQYFGTGGSTYYFGTGPTSVSGVRIDELSNPQIMWEKSNKLNVGLKATLVKNSLSAQVEYYNNKYYDLLMASNAPTIVGVPLGNRNIGINRYRGYEFQLTWQKSSKNFSYYISGNASTVQSKVLYQDEIFQQYNWMQRTGLPVGQTFGYVAEGLYQSQTEIASHAKMDGYSAQPGDIKYKDLNGDGVINQFDQTAIGTTKPLFFYGINFGFSVKGVDFSALIQGVENRNLLLTGNSEWEFQNGGFGQVYEQQLNRWTPATASTATYPRLTVGTNFNNHVISSYWMHSGDYLRLKNIEVGYTLPVQWISKIKLSSVRLFCNATNLLTFSGYDRVDPETNGGVYPIQRTINGGINVKF